MPKFILQISYMIQRIQTRERQKWCDSSDLKRFIRAENSNDRYDNNERKPRLHGRTQAVVLDTSVVLVLDHTSQTGHGKTSAAQF